MISYKQVAKIKYTKNPSDVVTLTEYILFEDEAHERKHAVLKFSNNLDQPLYAIQFEIYQYDVDDNLIAKSLVVSDKFRAEANTEFVPKAKLRLSVKCASISLKLISADFDRIRWEKGNFVTNKYKFRRYVGDVGAKGAPRGEQPAPVQQSNAAADKKKKKLVSFQMRNIYSKNMARFPRVFGVLAVIILIAFTVATSLWFTKTSKRFSVEDYDLMLTGENTVTVMGYDGEAADVKVPERIGDYTVTKIAGGAFGYTKVKSVEFDVPNLIIESAAFSGCSTIEKVSSYADNVRVFAGAFEYCDNLAEVSMPTAIVAASSFADCGAVTSFDVYSTTANKLSDVFDGAKNIRTEVDITMPTVVPEGYFDGMSVSMLITKNDNYKLSFGSLAGVEAVNGVQRPHYTYVGDFELLSGEVSDVRGGITALTVPASVTAFDTVRFRDRLSGVESLTLEGDMIADSAFFTPFYRLATLTVLNLKAIQHGLPLSCGATTLNVPVSDIKLSDCITGSSVKTVNVTGGRFYGSTASFVENVNLDSLEIGGEVEVASCSLSGTRARSLTLPLAGGGKLSDAYIGLGAALDSTDIFTLISGKGQDALTSSALDGVDFNGSIDKLVIRCASAAAGSLASVRALDSLELLLDRYGETFSSLFGPFDSEEPEVRMINRVTVYGGNVIPTNYFDDSANNYVMVSRIERKLSEE